MIYHDIIFNHSSRNANFRSHRKTADAMRLLCNFILCTSYFHFFCTLCYPFAKLNIYLILTIPVPECIQELEQKRLKTTDHFSTLRQAGLPAAADEIPDNNLTPEVVGESQCRQTVGQDQPPTDTNEAETPETAGSNGDKSDVFEPLDEPRSIFCDVFSEDDEEEDEKEDVEEEQDGWVLFFRCCLFHSA